MCTVLGSSGTVIKRVVHENFFFFEKKAGPLPFIKKGGLQPKSYKILDPGTNPISIKATDKLTKIRQREGKRRRLEPKTELLHAGCRATTTEAIYKCTRLQVGSILNEYPMITPHHCKADARAEQHRNRRHQGYKQQNTEDIQASSLRIAGGVHQLVEGPRICEDGCELRNRAFLVVEDASVSFLPEVPPEGEKKAELGPNVGFAFRLDYPQHPIYRTSS
jgi:hypothetical protein